MHIIKIIHGYPLNYNAGSEVYSQSIVNELVKTNKVTVFSREENDYESDVSENEAAKRLLKANRLEEFKNGDIEQIRQKMNIRNEQMRNRFIQVYNTDFTEKSNYSLVVDTEEYDNIETIANMIIASNTKE